jgi:predicted nucleic acid-binding protein
VTTAIVVDASAIAAVIFNEPERDDVLKKLTNRAFHAPSFLQSELANVAVKKARRNPTNEAHYMTALAELDLLPMTFHSVNAREVAALAMRTQLWAYDASYLWLALSLGMPLVTLDTRLEAVAAAMTRP